jgi:hypothetical protein
MSMGESIHISKVAHMLPSQPPIPSECATSACPSGDKSKQAFLPVVFQRRAGATSIVNTKSTMSISARLVSKSLPVSSMQTVSSHPPKGEAMPPRPSDGKAKQQPRVAPKPVKQLKQRVAIDVAGQKLLKSLLAQQTQPSPDRPANDESKQPRLVVPKPVSSVQPAIISRPKMKSPANNKSMPSVRDTSKTVVNSKTGEIVHSHSVSTIHVPPKWPSSLPGRKGSIESTVTIHCPKGEDKGPSKGMPIQYPDNAVHGPSQNNPLPEARPTKESEPHDQAVGNAGYSAECPKDSSECLFECTKTSQWLASKLGQASILPGEVGEEWCTTYAANKINEIKTTQCSPEPSTAIAPSSQLSASPMQTSYTHISDEPAWALEAK